MKPIALINVALIAVMPLVGCVSSRSGRVYSRDDARQMHTVKYGTVESVNQVTIEGTKTPIGPLAGGVAGGAIGSRAGSGGDAQVIGTVVGAVVGAAAGALAEEGLTRRKGLEITVKQDDGTMLTLVQQADEEFYPGDRVRVLTGPDGTMRVRH